MNFLNLKNLTSFNILRNLNNLVKRIRDAIVYDGLSYGVAIVVVA
jgi:hypothetical protein